MGKNTQQPRNPVPPPPRPAQNRMWLFVALGLAVAIIAAIVVITVSGDDKKATEGTLAPGGGSASPAEVQPVTVVGDVLPVLGNSGADTALGMKAPVLNGFTFDGSPISINPDDGAYMVVFLAHWCPHCNREIPVLNEWKASGAIPADLRIIGVTTGVDASAPNYPPSKWIEEKAWTWPVLADSADSTALAAFGVGSFPAFAIVGSDGLVKFRGSGEYPIADLNQIVAAALG